MPQSLADGVLALSSAGGIPRRAVKALASTPILLFIDNLEAAWWCLVEVPRCANNGLWRLKIAPDNVNQTICHLHRSDVDNFPNFMRYQKRH